MDALAVELGDKPEGTEVRLIGNGVLVEEHARRLGTINYEVTCGIRSAPEGRRGGSSIDERLRQAVGGEEAYMVGGAVRDELLGRPGIDLDIALPDAGESRALICGPCRGRRVPPLGPPRRLAGRFSGRPDGRFTPLPDGIEADLGTRDFTINAIAIPLAGEPVDPFGGRGDLEAGVLRAVSLQIFTNDPIRLLRASQARRRARSAPRQGE